MERTSATVPAHPDAPDPEQRPVVTITGVDPPALPAPAEPSAAPSARPAKRASVTRSLVPYAYLSPTVILMFVLMLIPIVMVIGYSMMDNVIMEKHPRFAGLDNYSKVLSDTGFQAAIRNTLFFTVVSVIAHMLLGLGFAMLLNSPLLGRFSRAIFRTIYILPWLFTVAIIAVLWRLILNPNGAANYVLQNVGIIDSPKEWLGSRHTALNAVTFINIWSGYPFFMMSLLAGLQGIPRDLYEAATVDGANAFQRFWNITLTQLRPIIVAMALLDFIWTNQQFALIWMTTGGGPINSTEMFSTYTYKLAFSSYQFSQASASAVIILLVSMVLAYFYSRAQSRSTR
jgi:multiple sugar transport system permease protein